MRILIFHSYLLLGTGSNVYNARLAEALVALGHEVHLLSQDRHPERQPFIDAAGDWDGGSLRVRPLTGRPPRCTLYRPNIGSLLPVHVEDRYEDVEARTFQRCSDREIERYLQANVAAVAELSAFVDPDVALANHLVMGPAILARGLPEKASFAVKVHGSALEYTVKRAPDRFLPYAREGVKAASAVLVGSRYAAESLWAALGSEWVQRHRVVSCTRLGPPGVDVSRFRPYPAAEAAARLKSLSVRLASAPSGGAEPAAAVLGGELPVQRRADAFARTQATAGRSLKGEPLAQRPTHAFERDQAAAGRALSRLDPGRGPIVSYVGKLIVSKGVDLLLAAWPLVLEEAPCAQLAIVGFGSLRSALEGLLSALADGDLHTASEIASAGRALEGGDGGPLRHLQAFLSSLSGEDLRRYLAGCKALRESAVFVGRLEHDELAKLLPACQALVVPSTFPEAFGMVAVEAAASGVLPVSAAHSGLIEVSDALAETLPEEVASLLSFDVDDGAVRAISDRVLGWLSLKESTRAAARREMAETVRRRWSWEGVATGVISAAEGSLSALPRP